MKSDINHTLIYIWKAVGNVPGWRVYEKDNLVLLGSPTRISNLNICIGAKTKQDLEKAREFFGDRDFGLFEDTAYPLPFNFKAKADVGLEEMYLDTSGLSVSEMAPEISIVNDEADLKEWVNVASTVFGFNEEEMLGFMRQLTKLKNSFLFIARHNSQVMGTGQVNIDDTSLAYISSIAVLEEFRRHSIGTKLMNAAINYSIKNGASKLGLHASDMGKYLYDNLNFKKTVTWRFKILGES